MDYQSAATTNVRTSLAQINTLALIIAAVFTVIGLAVVNSATSVIQPTDILRSLVLALVLLFAPAIFPLPWGKVDETFKESLGTLGVLITVTLLGLAATLTALQPFIFSLLVIVASIGFGKYLQAVWPPALSKFSFLFATCAVLVGLFVLTLAWGSQYQSPLFFEQLVIGSAHKDTLFNSAVSGILRVQGVPSTGLDGAPMIAYHWGSHALIAALSQASGLSSLTFYNVGYQIILIPLFFKVFGLFILSIRRIRHIPPRLDAVFVLVLSVAFIHFLPGKILWDYATWDDPIYLSESYLVGLIWAFLFVDIAIRTLVEKAGRNTHRLFLLVALPAMILIMALTKIAIGALAVALYGFWLLRTKKLFSPSHLVSGLLVLAAFLLIYRITWVSDSSTYFEPFFFQNSFVKAPEGLRWAFFVIHYQWVWTFLLMMFVIWRMNSLRAAFGALKSGRLQDLELLIVLAIVGYIPGALINFGTAGPFYFSDVQRWFGIALALAYLPLLDERLRLFWKSINIRFSMGRLGKVALLAAPGIFLVLLAYAVLHRVENRVIAYADEVSSDKRRYADALKTPEGERRKALRDQLLTIRNLTRSEKQDSCLYIPKSNAVYWTYLERDGAAPLVAPAVSEVRSIYGLPEKKTSAWGYDQYDFAFALAVDATNEQLWARAIEQGCQQILILGQDQKVEKVARHP